MTRFSYILTTEMQQNILSRSLVDSVYETERKEGNWATKDA